MVLIQEFFQQDEASDGIFVAVIFAFSDDRFATAALFKTVFV
jgi:hypothetical protein